MYYLQNQVKEYLNPNSHELNVSIFYQVIANKELDAIKVNFSPDGDLNNSLNNSPGIGNY